jgi:hypothetical protein
MVVLADDDVAGLEVAVQKSALMRAVERLGNGGAVSENLFNRKGTGCHARCECSTWHVFHHEEVAAFARIEIEYRGYAGM